MKNELTLAELKEKLSKAQANYDSCGCKKYREEVDALRARIAYLESQK